MASIDTFGPNTGIGPAQVATMVDDQLAGRGISDAAVLDAFRAVRREDFMPADLRDQAYDDAAYPIGEGQTISQPFVVALTAMAMELGGDERVLEIGTGSGYAAAIFSKLAAEVYTVERIESLAIGARERLARLGYDRVHVAHADGTRGWPEHAPYNAIAVAAAAPEPPRALLEQLAEGGRLVAPIGPVTGYQVLTQYTRRGSQFIERPLCNVRFVPLIGDVSG